MAEATQKQISYARKLGIGNPESYTKEALSKLIDERTGKTSVKPVFASQNGSNEVSQHSIVIQRVEKPHSYEFGKAGNRHKVYYQTVQDLIKHIEELKSVGLADIEDIVGVEKI